MVDFSVADPVAATVNLQPPPKAVDPNAADYDLNSGKYFFGRVWAVSLGVKEGTAKTGGNLVSSFAQTTRTALRTTFEIEKTAFSRGNKGKVQVYNLSAEARSKYAKGLLLTLLAGYEGFSDILFFGNVTQVKNERKNADIVTTFECGEGEKQLYTNFLSKSYPAKTPIAVIVNDLVKALGLPVGLITGLSPTAVSSSGVVVCGGVKKYLDTILLGLGLEWSVQQGSVFIRPIGQPNAGTAIEINQNTGLIGVPTKGDGGNNLTTFSSLLNPKLVPGATVNVTSNVFTGVFQIRTVKYEGDSHGPKWLANCECTPVGGASSLGNIAAAIASSATGSVVGI